MWTHLLVVSRILKIIINITSMRGSWTNLKRQQTLKDEAYSLLSTDNTNISISKQQRMK